MSPPATPQRYAIVGFASMAALWMYIDRVCLSTLADRIQKDLNFDGDQKAWILGAFFLAYALCQIPTGSLADRFGQRKVLTACIVGWSLVTALTGFVEGFLGLLVVRLLLGVAEAGAYPAAAGLVKNWAQPTERGRFSSFVALGGRIGGAVAPFLTAFLALAFVGWGPAHWTADFPNESAPNGIETINWRMVFVFFGLCGLAVAAAFWVFVRDRPDDAAGTSAPRREQRPFWKRMAVLANSRNMILFATVQFGANVGWAPLVTLLPTYLNEVFKTPLKEIGAMQSTALTIGCLGMLLGGFFTDFMHKNFGGRWGRSVPIVLAKSGCVLCCLAVTQVDSAWTAILILGAMAFLVDMGNPSIWAFAQDVGGKNVGAALGWGNMFGNLGAFASPILLTMVKNAAGWNAAFLLCAGAFAAAGVAGFLLNASKPLEDHPGESR
jgi:ACS family glucarate transporter-like MFS transporter